MKNYRVNFTITGYKTIEGPESSKIADFWVKNIIEQALFKSDIKAQIDITLVKELEEAGT